MKDYSVTVSAESGIIRYTVRKTLNGAESFGKKLANDAFYGESYVITIEEV